MAILQKEMSLHGCLKCDSPVPCRNRKMKGIGVFLAGPKNPVLVLSARLAIRHCKAKVGSAVIKRNSWSKGRQPLNPDSPADAANVKRALHSRRYSTSRPAGRERASSH